MVFLQAFAASLPRAEPRPEARHQALQLRRLHGFDGGLARGFGVGYVAGSFLIASCTKGSEALFPLRYFRTLLMSAITSGRIK